jgi:HPt (histidine-containing phosphotransfer) domain-containing protein
MLSWNGGRAAFAMPGGESSARSKPRPIDLSHLACQTMGDRELEREVLDLFLKQASLALEKMLAANPQERGRLAHGLKGAARGVGAFPVAKCAAEIEAEPRSRGHLQTLRALIGEARDFISAINR